MRKPSTELFDLIRSLSKSEKRYFKLFATRHIVRDKNNYLKLFEAVDRLLIYDEEKLKRLIAEEKMAEYLSAAKYYLYTIILESLHAFHEESSIDAKIKKAIHQAELLYEKGLIDHSKKLLKMARQWAYEHDRFQYILDILALEKKIIARAYFKGLTHDALQEIYQEERQCIEKLANANEYWRLHGQAYLLHYTKGQARTEDETSTLNALLSAPLLKSESKALSFKAKLDFFQTSAICHFGTGKTEKAYEFNRRFLELLEAHPNRMREFAKRYMASLNNFMIDSLRLKRFDEVVVSLQKFRGLPDNPEFARIDNIHVDVFRLGSILEMNMLLDNGRFSVAADRLDEIQQGLTDYGTRIVAHNRVTLHYLGAYAAFGAGEYSKSALWVNHIINDTDEGVVEDIYAFARVLQLFIHFELGNFELIDYLLKSAQRYLNKRNRLYQVESLVLKFMKKQGALKTRAEIQPLLQSMLEELIPLQNDPIESRAFGYFDLVSWVKSKIEKRPFDEIVTQRSGVLQLA